MKAANSPRPAAWILERSLDGENFQPWQYYAPSDGECWTRYSAPPVAGKPVYIADDEVICISQYSRQTPMENGEVRTWFLFHKARKKCGPPISVSSFYARFSFVVALPKNIIVSQYQSYFISVSFLIALHILLHSNNRHIIKLIIDI